MYEKHPGAMVGAIKSVIKTVGSKIKDGNITDVMNISKPANFSAHLTF